MEEVYEGAEAFKALGGRTEPRDNVTPWGGGAEEMKEDVTEY